MRAIPSVITIASVIATGLLLPVWWHDGRYAALSIATGYVAAALLLMTLLVTPVYALVRHRSSPFHLPLRRSLGVHAAVIAGLHTILSFPVHLGGDVPAFFFEPNGGLLLTRFGLSNWLGLCALAVLALLAATSTDGVIRRLGPPKWKRVHQLVYVAAGLTVVHAIAYQSIRNATALPVVAVVLATCALVGMRVVGWLAIHGQLTPRGSR